MWLQQHGFQNCIIERDCQVEVFELQDQNYLTPEHGNLLEDCYILQDINVHFVRLGLQMHPLIVIGCLVVACANRLFCM